MTSMLVMPKTCLSILYYDCLHPVLIFFAILSFLVITLLSCDFCGHFLVVQVLIIYCVLCAMMFSSDYRRRGVISAIGLLVSELSFGDVLRL